MPGVRARSQSKVGCETPSTKPNGSTPPMWLVGKTSTIVRPPRSTASRVVRSNAPTRSGFANSMSRICGSRPPTPHRQFAGALAPMSPRRCERFALPAMPSTNSGPESLNNRFLDAESPQSCGGEGNLCRFGDLRGNSVRREIRQRSRPEPAEPGPRRARVGDAQQQIARAGQRAEGGFRDRLNVGAVDVPSRHASKPGHISASQRRISSSLIVAFSKPLRMRVLRARSRAVRPG